MDTTKPWWQSKTLWGSLGDAGCSGPRSWPGSISPIRSAEALTEMMTSLGAAIGGLIAMFGRISAQGPDRMRSTRDPRAEDISSHSFAVQAGSCIYRDTMRYQPLQG
jgi:hypothetical protein